MRRGRTRLWLVLLVLCLGWTLASCGRGYERREKTNETIADVSVTPTSTPAPTPDPAYRLAEQTRTRTAGRMTEQVRETYDAEGNVIARVTQQRPTDGGEFTTVARMERREIPDENGKLVLADVTENYADGVIVSRETVTVPESGTEKRQYEYFFEGKKSSMHIDLLKDGVLTETYFTECDTSGAGVFRHELRYREDPYAVPYRELIWYRNNGQTETTSSDEAYIAATPDTAELALVKEQSVATDGVSTVRTKLVYGKKTPVAMQLSSEGAVDEAFLSANAIEGDVIRTGMYAAVYEPAETSDDASASNLILFYEDRQKTKLLCARYDGKVLVNYDDAPKTFSRDQNGSYEIVRQSTVTGSSYASYLRQYDTSGRITLERYRTPAAVLREDTYEYSEDGRTVTKRSLDRDIDGSEQWILTRTESDELGRVLRVTQGTTIRKGGSEIFTETSTVVYSYEDRGGCVRIEYQNKLSGESSEWTCENRYEPVAK